jgi:hypothetical protein
MTYIPIAREARIEESQSSSATDPFSKPVLTPWPASATATSDRHRLLTRFCSSGSKSRSCLSSPITRLATRRQLEPRQLLPGATERGGNRLSSSRVSDYSRIALTTTPFPNPHHAGRGVREVPIVERSEDVYSVIGGLAVFAALCVAALLVLGRYPAAHLWTLYRTFLPCSLRRPSS